jgi:uncharacterized protein Yka (UPF0111/DUF47 family)
MTGLSPLDRWTRDVAHHLHEIEAGADIIERHVDQMLYQPDFETKAEAALSEVARTLANSRDRIERCFIRVCNARRAFREKPHGKPSS